jgi:hypothetical protein
MFQVHKQARLYRTSALTTQQFNTSTANLRLLNNWYKRHQNLPARQKYAEVLI